MTASVSVDLPHLIVRGTDTALSVTVEEDGVVQSVSGTARVYDESGTQIGSTYTITATTTPSITVAGADTSGKDLSERWRVEWDLGTGRQSQVNAHLVRRGLAPVLTDAGLYRRAPALDPDGTTPLTTRATFAPEREEAWILIQRRLINAGRRPWLVMEPDALREAHLLLTLALIYETQAQHADSTYLELADRYRERFEAEWQTLAFRYDEDEDGLVDEAGRKGASTSLWTMPL